jgi:prevent-host-death family protein
MLSEQIPLADVKNRFSEVIDRIRREHGRVVVTRHGQPAAVILSIEDLESLEETLEILSDPELLKAIKESEEDVRRGRVRRLTKEEALTLIKKR